jgi:hypothetical protein
MVFRQKGVGLFYDTFNNISVILWRSVLLVEEIGVPGENHRPVASYLQHNKLKLKQQKPH